MPAPTRYNDFSWRQRGGWRCSSGLARRRTLGRNDRARTGRRRERSSPPARGDEAEARRLRAILLDLPGSLSARQLRLLPDLAAEGAAAAVALMVRFGWPVAVRGGDWDASALNLAVFRGDAGLTRLLLEHGALWTEQHGHGDNVCGTLSWASRNEPVEGGDWVGCARALLDHGMPRAEPDRDGSDAIVIGGRRKRFSDEVSEVLLGDAP